jgi:hypothetical protein
VIPAQIVAAADALVAFELAHAFAAFKDRPSAENYKGLTAAMVVHQQWACMTAAQRSELADTKLRDAGIGQWSDIIVLFKTGMTTPELLNKHG